MKEIVKQLLENGYKPFLGLIDEEDYQSKLIIWSKDLNAAKKEIAEIDPEIPLSSVREISVNEVKEIRKAQKEIVMDLKAEFRHRMDRFHKVAASMLDKIDITEFPKLENAKKYLEMKRNSAKHECKECKECSGCKDLKSDVKDKLSLLFSDSLDEN